MNLHQKSASSFTLPQYFAVVFVLCTLVSAGLTLASFRVYTTTTTLAIVPQSSVSAAMATEAIGTLSRLPETGLFYDQLIQRNADITDPWADASAVERRSLWAEHISSTRVGESGLVKIAVSGPSVTQSRLLTERVTGTLSVSAETLYGAGALRVSMAEAPLSQATLADPLSWVVAALSFGFLATLAIFALMQAALKLVNFFVVKRARTGSFVPKRAWEAPLETNVSTTETTLYRPLNLPNRSLSQPSQPISMPVVEPAVATEPVKPVATVPAVQPAPVVASGSTASAPANLPFDEDTEEEFSWEKALPGLHTEATPAPAPQAVKMEETPQAIVTPSVSAAPEVPFEPTEEDLKRRLNELLRGK